MKMVQNETPRPVKLKDLDTLLDQGWEMDSEGILRPPVDDSGYSQDYNIIKSMFPLLGQKVVIKLFDPFGYILENDHDIGISEGMIEYNLDPKTDPEYFI